MGAEHHCDGRARYFLNEAASNLVRSSRYLDARAAKSDVHVIGPSDDAFEEEPDLSRIRGTSGDDAE